MFTPQNTRRIPTVMGTQHPDNASPAFWCQKALIDTTLETEEMVHDFFDLGCEEYMWDWEGKFADEAMLEKLFTKHHEAFKNRQLGKDVFLTLRVPNVWEEKSFKLARAYMSVLSGAEFVEALDLHSPPVFEFILPMTKRADQLMHIQETFEKTAKLHQEIFGKSSFGAGYIHIIPLFESVEDLAGCASVIEEFLKLHHEHFGFTPPYLRVFIARSDPALNAGFIPAVLATRLALRELYRISEKHKLPIYPIIGTGSLPFRGGINPENVRDSLKQYTGAKTITIQSAFRYDYPLEEVQKAIEFIKESCANPQPLRFEDSVFEQLQKLCQDFKTFYTPLVEDMAPWINALAAFVPKRRERVQHVGLFGYSRGIGQVQLPRAITFTAACYSLGLPPEFFGTGRALALAESRGELELLKEHFFTLEHELHHAGKFLNKENLEILAETEPWAKELQKDIAECERILKCSFGPQKDQHFLHRNLTSNILHKHRLGLNLEADLLEAATMRKSLG